MTRSSEPTLVAGQLRVKPGNRTMLLLRWDELDWWEGQCPGLSGMILVSLPTFARHPQTRLSIDARTAEHALTGGWDRGTGYS